MRRHVLDLIALGTLGLLAGCPDRAVSEVNTVPQGATTKEIPVSADIDILFVIDNSSSTADKRSTRSRRAGRTCTSAWSRRRSTTARQRRR
jgi:hypothetical protein